MRVEASLQRGQSEINHSCVLCCVHSDEAVDLEEWKRSRSESSTAADDLDSTHMARTVCINT